MRRIYLDHNATTPVAPQVRDAMLPFLDEHFGNPSSTHVLGRAAFEAVEDARFRLARLLGVAREEIVFTSGGTESNNLALKGTAFHRGPAAGGHVVVSAIEHPAVLAPALFLETLGFGLSIVEADRHGVVHPEAVEAALRPDTVLVSIMHANNEIGTVQPIAAIARICRARGVLVHTDAAQTVGKIPVRPAELGVDLLSVAGHKMYGPKGVGALYVRKGVALEPLLHGAGHEGGLRAGTENVAQIVGLGAAAALVGEHLDDDAERIAGLRDRLLMHLRGTMGEGLTVFGEGAAARLPNTLAVALPGVDAAEVLRRAPEVCASIGAACHAGSHAVSPTLAALGIAPEVARGAMRLSLGRPTDRDEIDLAAGALLAAWDSARASAE